MTDTNNTDGAALLPVTHEDREAFREICLRGDSGPNIQQMLNSGAWDDDYRMQELIRFRQSRSLPGDGPLANELRDAFPAGDKLGVRLSAHMFGRILAALTPSALSGDAGEGE